MSFPEGTQKTIESVASSMKATVGGFLSLASMSIDSKANDKATLHTITAAAGVNAKHVGVVIIHDDVKRPTELAMNLNSQTILYAAIKSESTTKGRRSIHFFAVNVDLVLHFFGNDPSIIVH